MSQIDDFLSGNAPSAPKGNSQIDSFLDSGPSTDGALARGWNKAKRSIATTSQLATGNAAGAAQTIKEADDYARANPGMQEGKELSQAWERGDGIIGGIKEVGKEIAKDWNEAPGIVGGLRATGRNLRAMGEGIVEQVPNMIAPVAGMVGGGAAGAAAGSAVPILGNVAGGALGAFAGASAGNTLVEGGGLAQEAIQKAGIDPQDTAAVERFLAANGDKILGQSAVKGSIIGAVDTLTAGLGGRVLNAPARAAANRALTELGVDLTNRAAVKAAMSTPQFAAKIAGDATYKAALSGAGNVARNAGVAALDPAGEFAGEFVGQGVATGDWDTKNAALEAFSSIGQSGIMFAGQKGYQALTKPNSKAAPKAPPSETPPAPLLLGNTPEDTLIVMPDGSVGRKSEIEAHLASFPPEEAIRERARLMGFGEQPGTPEGSWEQEYLKNPLGRPYAPVEDHLANLQQAIRSGTQFTTPETVDQVRNAMEDAWLTENVLNDGAAAVQAADDAGNQISTLSGDIAATDARVRTSRILEGLQNTLNDGTANAVQAVTRVNDALTRIGEPPLSKDEMGRARRILDAHAAFTGQTTEAPLPADPVRATDLFADNSSMESVIPERPSVRMGLNPADGPLSKAAATAVDTGTSLVQRMRDAQAPQAPMAGAAAALPATGTTAVEAAGTVSQPAGVNLVDQTPQTQQSRPAPPSGGTAPQDTRTQGPLTDAAPIGNNGAQAGSQTETQGKAPTQTVARPDNWRTSMLRAGPIAKGLGIDVRGKRLAQVLAEIDAIDGANNAPVRNLRTPDGRAPGAENTAQNGAGQPIGSAAPAVGAGQRAGSTAVQPAPAVRQGAPDATGAGESSTPVGKEVSRDIGQFQEGMSEFRANQRRNELQRQNPDVVYTAEEDPALKNGWVVVGREKVSPKQEALKAKQAEKRAEAPAEPQEVTHNGTRIYRTRIKVGDEVKSMWAVETPENKARREADERTLGGDTLHDTIEQAKAAADREAKQYAERKAFAEQQDAAERARKEAEEARKASNRGKSLVELRKEAVLGKQVRDSETGQVSTRREWVERKVDAGLKTSVTQEDRIKPLSRAQFNRASNAEQAAHERKIKEAGKKDVYWIGGFEVTKIEHDYAQEVIAKRENTPKTEASPASAPQQTADPFLPEGWTKTVNGFTNRPVYRMNQGIGEPFAVVTQTGAMEYEVQIRHGDRQLTVSTQRGALSEVLAGAQAELAKMTQAASATHKDPGEKTEAATKAVVSEALQTAARNEGEKPSDMRKWLLGEIDKALLNAPDRADYDDKVRSLGEKSAIEGFIGGGPFGNNAHTGFLTFDVPGDGKFKVRNSVRGLLEFRRNVNASQGFKDNGQKTAKPEQNPGVQGGSGGRVSAIVNMIEEGDFEAARDYAEAVGINLDEIKVPKGDRKPQWEAFRKTGVVPEQKSISPEWDITTEPNGVGAWSRVARITREVDGSVYAATVRGGIDGTGANYEITKDGKKFSAMTSRQPFSRALELAETALPQANDKPSPGKASDTGWNMRAQAQASEKRFDVPNPPTWDYRLKQRGGSTYLIPPVGQAFTPETRRALRDWARDAGFSASIITDNEISVASVTDGPSLDYIVDGVKEQAYERQADKERAAIKSATGTRRDPTKVSMFNPYNDGDIVTIDGQDWTVKADTPGWYLTTTGNWRGQHPAIRNVKAMADLIREVEQAAEAKPATVENAGPVFSRSAAAEVRNLVTLHNLTEDNLAYADQMGGIPVPSIGITKVDTPFSGFGNITLIAPKQMIDPKNGVPVYDRDAWTARFPTLNFKKVKTKLADAFYERMKPVRDLMAGEDDGFISQLWDRLRNASVQSPEKIIELFQQYDAGRVMYAKEVLGKSIKIPTMAVTPREFFAHEKPWLDFVKSADWSKADLAANDPGYIALRQEAGAAAKAAAEAYIAKKVAARAKDAENAGKLHKIYADLSDGLVDGAGLLNDAVMGRARRDAGTVGTKSVDMLKLREAVEKTVKRDDPGYLRWAQSLVQPLFEAPTITLRGKEVPATLDNIVASMTVGATAGVEKSMTFSPGKAAAMLGKKFKSLDEIKAARDQVVSQQAEAEGKKAADAILEEYRTHVSQFYTGKDWRGNIDTWAANDDSMEALAKAGKMASNDIAIRSALSRMNFKNVDAKAIELARQSIDALRNAATDYFEAKPQRAVTLDEFRGAVVPKGASPETIAILEKHGITVEMYGKTDGAREKAIQKLAKRLDKESGDVLMSRTQSARTLTPTQSTQRQQQAQALVDALSSRWTNAPAEIVVARNMQDAVIPQEVRDYDALLKSRGATGEPRGFLYKGTAYLISDQLGNAQQTAETLFHEVLGHFGLRGVFGKSLNPILQQMGTMRRRDVTAKAMEYRLFDEKALGVAPERATSAQIWAAMSDKQRLEAAEEVLAEMAQSQPNIGFVTRAIAAIRNWLRANVPGFEGMKLTDNDIIQAYILPARGWVERGNQTGMQSLERVMRDAGFSRAPTGDQTQTENFRRWFSPSPRDVVAGLPKSATGNNGQFNPANPDIRFSRASTVGAGYTVDQTQAAERAFGTITQQTLAQRAKSMRANLGLKLRQGLVDQFAPIKDVSEKAYILARMTKGSDGAVEAAILYGKPFVRDGVYDVDIKDGGFGKVLASLKGEHDRFFQWVAAQRAERLKAEGKENLLTDTDITALKTLNAGNFADGSARMPVYAAALKELNAFNEATLKIAMDSGLIDQAAYDLMKDQPYVPFYRIMEEDNGLKGPAFSAGLVNQQAWKKLKGGTSQLNADLLQNMLLNWSHLYSAASRNRASLETMDAASSMGIAYRVPMGTKDSVMVRRDGLSEHWAVEDPYLLDAITAMHYAPGSLVKALSPFKRLLTFGVTVNPAFKIRNLIRDSLSAISQSDLGYNPLANVANGWKATSKDSQTYASMLASGGVIRFGTQENSGRVRDQIEQLGGNLLDKKGFDKLKGQMKALWEVYDEFGDRTENVNRAALYERLIAKGHSHAEASFMARDLMDFSMSGKWEVVRFLTQTVPFLNARLQGLYKLGRAAKEDPKRFAAMAGAVSLVSLGLMMAYEDDEDWKRREDWDRDTYWWFKIGDTAFRVPKPFELGSIGTMAERTAELMFSKEMTGKRFGQRVSDMVFNTFAMDPTPQFIKPFLDVYANKDSFSGRPIEGMADERLKPEDRYNERTSEVARLLGSWGLPDPVRLAKGEYSGLSPKQVDFLLRGYFGWLATVSTTATDTVIRPMLDRGERPEMRMRDTFLAGNFVEKLPTGSSRYVTVLYEQSRQMEQSWASYQAALKSGDTEKAQEIMAEDGPMLRNRLAVNAAKRQISEIGQQVKRIEANRLMSGEAKRLQLEALEQRKHQIAKRVAPTS